MQLFAGDGKSPCTSCVDKHIKRHPEHSEELAIQLVQQEQRCLYETFVRRRGKGKKTIEKEREELLRRSGFQIPMPGSADALGMGISDMGLPVPSLHGSPHMDNFNPSMSMGYYR